MPSPFPGMDPYLEDPAYWSGFHVSMIVAIMAGLNRVLPDGCVAKIDEYVWVQDSEDFEKSLLGRPDVFVPTVKRPNGTTAVLDRPGTKPTALSRLPANRKRKNRIVQIVTGRDERVLTVLELLSPSNKARGEDRDAYMQKRREYLATVNLIEIDLLRGGHRMPMGMPDPPPADYYVFSCKQSEFPNTEIWTFGIRDPFPVIPIPLTPDRVDVPLDLAAAFDRVYEEGRYQQDVDYRKPPGLRLREPDQAWAETLLKKSSRKRR